MDDALRRHGIVTARELLARERDAATGAREQPTGLGGLLRRGSMLELVGRASTGRMSLVLEELAAVTSRGDGAVFVDLGDHLDSDSLYAAGIAPRRMLWVRPRDLASALSATETVLPAGLPLVVLDLGMAPIRGRRKQDGRGRSTAKGPAAAWMRLARAARDFHVALLLSTPYRIGGTAARTLVELRRDRTLWSPGEPVLFEGLESTLRVVRIRDEDRDRSESSFGTYVFRAPWFAACEPPIGDREDEPRGTGRPPLGGRCYDPRPCPKSRSSPSSK